MTERRNPRVGVIAESNLQRLALCHAVRSSGYELTLSCGPERAEVAALQEAGADAWLVDLNESSETLERLLEHAEAPLLFGIEAAPMQGSRQYPVWERRVFVKLRNLIGDPVVEERLDALEAEPAHRTGPLPLPAELAGRDLQELRLVCLLGASLGGPAAVKEFLDCLPDGLPVAFVLAQHIDGRMVGVLPSVLSRHNRLRIRLAGEASDRLRNGEVVVAPVAQEIDFTSEGEILARDKGWDGPYSPSIDQVLANLTRRFGKRVGALVFSGMGGDGAISAPLLRDAGGFVWAQSSDTCACPSQPESVRATGCVSFVGTPVELAQHLVDHVRSLWAVASRGAS